MSSPNEDIPDFQLTWFLAFCIIVLVSIILCTNGTYSVFCYPVWLVLFPAVSSTWKYIISVALSSKKHWPKLFVPLHLFASLGSYWFELPIRLLGSMSLLPCRIVPSSWQICSFSLLLSQVLNLGFFASFSSPAQSYWECFQRTLVVSSFLFPEP